MGSEYLRSARRPAILACALLTLATVTAVASAQDDAVGRGERVFDYWCAPCHDPGPGHPGTQSLEIKYRGTDQPSTIEDRTDLTPELVKVFVRQGILSMAPFRKTEITDAELDALAAYLAQ
jgi:mono/diheme cytochrome c family protein